MHITIAQGRLDFDPWEQTYWVEFDGRRSKRVLVKIMGERLTSSDGVTVITMLPFGISPQEAVKSG